MRIRKARQNRKQLTSLGAVQFPVASAWAQAYSASNQDYTVTVAGGGSGAGASKVCSTEADSVNIGDMSREWKSSEATVNEDGYTYDCVNSDVSVTQLIVAVDGLSVVIKKTEQLINVFLRWEDFQWHNSGGFSLTGQKTNLQTMKEVA